MPYRCKCMNCGLEFYAILRNEPAQAHLAHAMECHPHDLRKYPTKKIDFLQYSRRHNPRTKLIRRNIRKIVEAQTTSEE